MKILTAAEMRAADEATFKKIGVPSRVVMESAGRSIAQFIGARFHEELASGVLIVCGPGNNGGDGYVIARALNNCEIPTLVVALSPLKQLKGDAATAAMAYQKSGGELLELLNNNWDELSGDMLDFAPGLIVDAIFGIGLTRKVDGQEAAAIDFLNSMKMLHGVPVLSVDIPSGLHSDTGEVLGKCIRASITCAIQCLKLGHVLAPGILQTGDIYVVDCGISESVDEVFGVPRELTTQELVAGLLYRSGVFSPTAHKGTRGHVLIVGGSPGKFGAPQLSARAVLNAGAGLATVFIAEGGDKIVLGDVPEIMFFVQSNSDKLPLSEVVKQALEGKDALVLGPGMGTSEEAAKLLRAFLEAAKKEKLPTVVDADALNLISQDEDLLRLVSEDAVLTPHPGEMARLLKSTVKEIEADRLLAAKRFSVKTKSVVLLKGARSVIAHPDEGVFIDPAATAALGTAGSGDVLSGVIAALIAQGLSPFDATVAGAFVHGAAGELLQYKGFFGILASDISNTVAEAMNRMLFSKPEEKDCLFWQRVLPGSLHSLASE